MQIMYIWICKLCIYEIYKLYRFITNWKSALGNFSVNIEHQLKSKLTWPVCWKWSFYWVKPWKLLFNGGMNFWWGESTGETFLEKRGMSKFLASGGRTPTNPLQRKPCCTPTSVKNFRPPIYLSLPRKGENLWSPKAR